MVLLIKVFHVLVSMVIKSPLLGGKLVERIQKPETTLNPLLVPFTGTYQDYDFSQ